MDAPIVVEDSPSHRYRLMAGAEELGFVDYDPVGTRTILVKHTEVKPEHEGKGYGSRLVQGMLDDLRARGKDVIPICPYTLAWLKRHRDYLDVVREDARAMI